jgi:serine/threonine protein kinase/Flp pilus assembly protein TadD
MPERIGAYRLESPLGRGGMGEVFLAWDERLERAVAIKRIRQDAFVLGHQRERFRREARLAARLSHAAIVQIHDLVSEESGDAIVMEYVEGLTLSERIARGPLATAEAVRLAREIAEGLAAAHEAGLIHRDLKAENVIVTPSGHAKILDFGLARPVSWDGEMLTLHGALIGTCYAMSPEQARGEELDERSDLFSFGALLYEMLTGRSPFRGKDPLTTLQRVLHEQPPLLSEVRSDLPLRLSSLVERLLAKDRNDRPRDALQVAHKLELIERELPAEEWPERNDDSLSDMPTQAFPSPSGSRPGATAPRSSPAIEGPLRRARGWMLFLAGALMALVIAVTASYLLKRSSAPSPVDTTLLDLQQKIDEGRGLNETDFARLEEIRRSPPVSLQDEILASEAYRSRFQSTGNASDRDLAMEHAQRAQDLSPSDPGPLIAYFRIALDWDLPTAERYLKQLEALTPEDPQLFVYRARLADRSGQSDRALVNLQAAVKRTSSWKNLYELADLEVRMARVDDARRHLNELLDVSQNNPWGLSKRAELELRYGDIALAEQGYLQAIEIKPRRTDYSSLGLARSLQGKYDGAIEAYRNALDMAPDSPGTLLNLAEAELALGHKAEADEHLRRTLESLDARRRVSTLSDSDSMIQAQCLARLGQLREAVKVTLQVLKKGSDDSQVLYIASLVYALADDRQSALVNAQEALDKGLQPEWFQLPVFPMRKDPELKAMLQKAASSRSS